ncbi:MAG: heme biosynthesis HemY N-terminal domain-containing protein [Caulobacteraceae bacterium]
MIRMALGVFLVAVLIVVGLALRGEPGTASLTWLGWRADTTAAAGVLLIGLLALLATVFWRALIWLLEAPVRAARSRADTRRRQGAEALTRGFLAAAAGEGAEARRAAGKAAELADEAPQLVRLLAAQAAEAAGERAAARAAYQAMLGFPEMRLAAHRGLMLAALAEGDKDEALAQAAAAYGLARTSAWAWRGVFEHALENADWSAALSLVHGALERKIISPLTAERARSALQAAEAAGFETAAAADARRGHEAAELACEAARARPDFTPAPVIAARLLLADGRPGRAAPLIEAAWKARPHPALWLAWRDLRTDETPRERARRLAEFAALAPGHREARILLAEQALVAGDPSAAHAAVAELADEPLTARLAGLHARVAVALGAADEARAWIARGAGAGGEPDWSDLDPQSGRAFAWPAADWARLIAAYAETGALVHPRFERGEAEIRDLPSLPAAYAESAPFISAAEAGEAFPPIFDDSDFGDALQPAAGEPDTVRGRLFRGLGARPKGR